MELIDSIIGKDHITGDFFLQEKEILDFPWRGTVFDEAKILGGSMMGSLFENCTFTNTTFENIHLDHVDFVRCHFESFKIINCSKDGMEIRECIGSPPTMTGTKMNKNNGAN
ncbi:MAG: hypothetical protein PHU04_03350 [Candidatus Peribacteraceae bacterium]|nr:hypothetical protein [Candidatus Peribacteraceae bacterium]